MPFALVILGLIFVITGVKGTIGALGTQLKSDFSGEGNFFYWFASIGSVGALGAIPEFRAFSRLFMTLIIVAMVIKNGGIFDKLISAISSGPIAPERDSTGAGGDQNGSIFNSLISSGSNIGVKALASTSAVASKSIATSGQQQSNPAQNLNALTKFIALFM